MINYSIIIPHYNIPDLLQRALDSIPQREDIEVIVVDDCSDPDVVDFDHFPGRDRLNTTCILQKQKGYAGVSRNIAIGKARGKWILCVDADDFLLPNAFDAIDKYRESDADVVVFKADSCMSDNITQKGKRQDAPYLCQLIDECIAGKRDNRNLLFSYWGPVCKIVKRQFLQGNHIKFATTPCSEDVIWCTGIAVHSSKTEVSNEYIYCVSEREGSLTNEINIGKLEIWIGVLQQRNQYLRKYNYEQYLHYFSYEDLLFLRQKGAFTYLNFCIKTIHKGVLKPCAKYGIEAKLHFKYPYIYLFLGLLNFPKISNNSFLHKIWKKLV